WWPDRLLQPFQAEFLQFPRPCSRFVQRPGTVHVDGELDVGAYLFAGSTNRRELYFVQFQTLESGVDCAPNTSANKCGIRITDQPGVTGESGAAPAQKSVNWRVGGLARNIPKRNVHRRDAKSQRRVSSEDVELFLNFDHERRNLHRVPPQTERRDQLVDRQL